MDNTALQPPELLQAGISELVAEQRSCFHDASVTGMGCVIHVTTASFSIMVLSHCPDRVAILNQPCVRYMPMLPGTANNNYTHTSPVSTKERKRLMIVARMKLLFSA
jgi:hypothetical protein